MLKRARFWSRGGSGTFWRTRMIKMVNFKRQGDRKDQQVANQGYKFYLKKYDRLCSKAEIIRYK